jgi:hypothetical protein
VFWSKIWLFLIALAAAVCATVALVMPRPAQRATLDEETTRLRVACGVVDVVLQDNARNRVELVGTFAREADVESALSDASAADKLDDNRMKNVRAVGQRMIKSIHGAQQPAFAILIDRRGRVVARIGIEEDDYGDTMSGRPLVDDALAGYLRDDLWIQGGGLYFVSASPVVKRETSGATYAGAVVLGYKATNELAAKLVVSPNVNAGFFVNGDGVATSTTVAIEASPLVASVKALSGPELAEDCRSNAPVDVPASGETYRAIAARLPGEAGAHGAFFAVFTPQPNAVGFSATLKQVTKSDLAPGGFPWPLVGGGFLAALIIGILLMLVEADRPLKKLTAESVRLAKGEIDRLSETQHGGKFGSIARSINIHIDKLARENKSAKKDFDQLLGPAPEGSLGTIDLLAAGLPVVRAPAPPPALPVSTPTPPPAAAFKFKSVGTAPGVPQQPPATPPPMPHAAQPPSIPVSDMGLSAPPPSPPQRPQTSPGMPPARAGTPPPSPMGGGGSGPATTAQSSAPMRLDDDILGSSSTPLPAELPAEDNVDPYFKSVYDQFLAMKKSCNEPITGLSYGKFAEKLVKNRDDLMAKTGCKEVRFTVYVKDGKAALKATPVKEEG